MIARLRLVKSALRPAKGIKTSLQGTKKLSAFTGLNATSFTAPNPNAGTYDRQTIPSWHLTSGQDHW